MKALSPIRSLPANTLGKDYVLGDLHGCYTLLEKLLQAVNFNIHQDRVFSVGDLIDRGPDSLRCLKLTEEPWFYAVQGNHEQMMLDFFAEYVQTGCLSNLDGNPKNGFLDYGGDWVKIYYQAGQQRMSAEFNYGLQLAKSLPIMWIVGAGDHRFHVLHAELVRPDYQDVDPLVWLDSDIDRWLAENFVVDTIKQRMTWGRLLMMAHSEKQDIPCLQTGLSLTFCGHTYAESPRQILSHLCLDTGAFTTLADYDRHDGKHGLTLFDVRESCYLTASYQQKQLLMQPWP